jgi:hypothetical protein
MTRRLHGSPSLEESPLDRWFTGSRKRRNHVIIDHFFQRMVNFGSFLYCAVMSPILLR